MMALAAKSFGRDCRSQTVGTATSYLTWNTTQALPLILNDGTNSYVYGPGNVPVEQISSGGTVLYLHHDQPGSTRMLTTSTSTKEASTTYDAYGNTAGTATTPLGYAAQYTSTDKGLIYLRARTDDPKTAQFLTVDPLASLTRAPPSYASDNPLSSTDPTGLEAKESNCTYNPEAGSNVPPFGGDFPYNPGQKGGAPIKLRGGL